MIQLSHVEHVYKICLLQRLSTPLFLHNMVSTICASVLKVIQLQGRPPFHFFLQPLFHVESHQVLPCDDSLHGVPTVYHRQVPQAQGTENYVCPLERKFLRNGQCRLVCKHFQVYI